MKITESFARGDFVVSAEVGPSKGIETASLVAEAKEYLSNITAVNVTDCQSSVMRLGSLATCKALKDAGLTIDDIQLIELNEAFAAQSLGCIKALHWEDKMDIINVNGGAVALGHPVGSSGSRIIITLMYEMKRRGLKYGLATLCIAGGMGQAVVIEMCD